MTNAVLDFAQKRAAELGKRERLRGRIEQAERDYRVCTDSTKAHKDYFWIADDLHDIRAALAALEKVEEVAR